MSDYIRDFNFKKVKGYIEGFYGKLLSWDNRIKILEALSKNNMNFYFYCPKEDIYHRQNWKTNYPNNWLKNFSKFCKIAKEKKIKIIAGISPGLSFNFKKNLSNKDFEYKLLRKKATTLMKHGANIISIMFDDIPPENLKNIEKKQEGIIHANLLNQIYQDNKFPLVAVPRIYADELLEENPHYIKQFFTQINCEIPIFYCGKYVVSNNFESELDLVNQKTKDNKLIFWDNFYANDYCPKRLIIGPWKNKNLLNSFMINGTGMMETDKLIIEIVSKTNNKKNKMLIWKNILKNNNVPNAFFKISKSFLTPNFTFEKNLNISEFDNQTVKKLDYLLWQWKSDLSREWYQYLLNFKHDLQILNNDLSLNRILKTQTNPMQMTLIKRGQLK